MYITIPNNRTYKNNFPINVKVNLGSKKSFTKLIYNKKKYKLLMINTIL